jgi:hypothetical protein
LDLGFAQGYKSPDLNHNKGLTRIASKEYEVKEDFFHLIDRLHELIPEAINKLDHETLICECFCVNAGDIRRICAGHVDLDLLSKKLNLGNGCHLCLKNKEDWMSKIF